MKREMRELASWYGAEWIPDSKGLSEFKEWVFPRYLAPVVGMSEGRRRLKAYRFGLIPAFEKKEKPTMIFHNARFETLAEKPSFRDSFRLRRCLIPLDSFAEFVLGPGEKKVRVEFRPRAGGLLTAAGVYQAWRSPSGELVPTFSMITREASPSIADRGHDRSPFFLGEKAFQAWLDPAIQEPRELTEVLQEGRFEPEWA